MAGLLRFCVESKRKSGAGSVQQVVRGIVGGNKMLLQRSVFDRGEAVDEGRKGKPDQVDLLLLIQRELAGRLERGKGEEEGTEMMMPALCLEMFEDVVEQEGLEEWWEDRRSREGEGMGKVRGSMEKFMETILAETDSEEEESSEEEEEEESEESDDDE